jgi:3-deoxy-D-manno-octulosonic-acid transferase
LEAGLDAVHARAYALIGARDPGEGLRRRNRPARPRGSGMIGKGSILQSYRILSGAARAGGGRACCSGGSGAARKIPTRLAERRGYPGARRPDKTLVWLHGASVGETVTLLPLVDMLKRRGFAVLVTSGTVTSAKLLAARLPAGVIHQYLPLDVPRYMRRFLDYWRPELGLICESEIWPNLMIEARRRGIPLALVNARMSERSFKRWYKLPQTSRFLLSCFESCLAQSQGDGERLAQLGAPRVSIAGNLKFDVPAPPADADTLAILDGLTTGRPVWIAASTHPGEDELVIAAHLGIKAHLPKLLTIIAPRHPQRGIEIERWPRPMASRSRGAPPARRRSAMSSSMSPTPSTSSACSTGSRRSPSSAARSCRSADTIRSSPPSWAAPCCMARMSAISPMSSRPSMRTAVRARSPTQALAGAVHRWLSDPASARQAARAAAQTSHQLGGALNRTMQAIEPLLMRVAIGQRESAS